MFQPSNTSAVDRTLGHGSIFATGIAFLLLLLAASIVAATFRMPVALPLAYESPPLKNIAATSLDPPGAGMLHPGGGHLVHVHMHVDLPPRADPEARWVLLLGRDLYDEISVSSGAWRSGMRSFFAPANADDGAIPSYFVFKLPRELEGAVVLDVATRRTSPGAVRALVVPEDVAEKMEERMVALTMSVYSGLFMLALVMLALYRAARDRAFLAYFAYVISGLLLLAGLNGHLYLLPGFSLLGLWQEQGLNVLAMLFTAAMLHILLLYADTKAGSPRLGNAVKSLCVALVVVSALALMNLPPLRGVVQGLTLLGWITGGVACVLVSADAGRRSVPMAWAIACLCILTLVAALAAQLLVRGVIPDLWWIRRGYQLTLLVSAAFIAVALASRIGVYRDQRDRARLAREDSELRVSRQTARLSLAEGLQAQLKHLPQGDVEWAAYRRVIDHLVPMLQLQSLAIVANGSEHHELLLVEPIERKDHVAQAIAKRHNMLKALARTRSPSQISLYETEAGTEGPQSALVPLQLRAPAWGAMILERAHGDGFTTEELTMASEFGRLAVEAVEEANTSLRLRRSAELDALTGTFNRRTLDQWLSRCFTDAHRANKDVSVLFVDLDHFKRVNDTHGHAAGDHCLRRTSAALRGVIGPGDLLGRYGGEEFMIVLPGATSDSARKLGEALRETVENLPIEWEGKALNITVSVGVATRGPHEQSPTTAIERADKALYSAKRSGRNRVHVAPAEFF